MIEAEWPTIHQDCPRAESYLSNDLAAAAPYQNNLAAAAPYQYNLAVRINDAVQGG